MLYEAKEPIARRVRRCSATRALRLALVALACSPSWAQAQAERVDVTRPVREGDQHVGGYISPVASKLTAATIEVLDAQGRLIVRRVGQLDENTKEFRVQLPEPLARGRRIRVVAGTAKDEVDVVARRLDPPTVVSSLRPGASVLRGRLVDPERVSQVRVEVTRGIGAHQAVVDAGVAQRFDDEGGFSVSFLRPLTIGDRIFVQAMPRDAAGEPSARVELQVIDPSDWGRSRAYFSGGVVLSKRRENAAEDDNFSQQDLALAFALDKAWLQDELRAVPGDPDFTSGAIRPRQLNTFFEARLTALPVRVVEDPAAEPPSDGSEQASETRGAGEFITSKKGAVMQIGTYVPFYGAPTSWRHRGEINSLAIGPLAKIGIQTITGDRATAELIIEGRDDVFTFWSYGFGVAHLRMSGLGRNGAPEVISYLYITKGKSEAFDTFPDPQNRRIYDRRFRFFVEGRLKIPETPLQIGFDGNLGEAEDDLRFVFGARFDVGELFENLRRF